MAIHPHTYNWSGVDPIDANSKASILDSSTSIDPSFSQAQHEAGSDDASFTGDHVAQAVATAQQAARQANSQAAHGMSSPQSGVSDTSMDLSRQGRPLTNTKRAQQNRQAQRAFRQRKELYIKDLESKVNELKQSKDTIDALRQENIQLRDYILALQSRLIEHPGGVPTPPAVYARQTGDIYGHRKNEK